jgi:hypothetical protein
MHKEIGIEEMSKEKAIEEEESDRIDEQKQLNKEEKISI